MLKYKDLLIGCDNYGFYVMQYPEDLNEILQPTIYDCKLILTSMLYERLEDRNHRSCITWDTSINFKHYVSDRLYVKDYSEIDNPKLAEMYMFASGSSGTFKTYDATYTKHGYLYNAEFDNNHAFYDVMPVIFWFEGDWYVSRNITSYRNGDYSKIVSIKPDIPAHGSKLRECLTSIL